MTEALQKVVETELDSGHVVLVAPVSPYFLMAVEKKAQELYPLPDPSAYEKAVPEDEALYEGQTIPAVENPDYRQLVNEVEYNRALHQEQAIIFASIVDVRGGKQALIEHYAEQLKMLRQYSDLPADDWQALLLTVIVRTLDDRKAIVNTARLPLPVTDAEVADGFAIFRNNLSQRPVVGRNHRTKARNLPQTEQLQPEPDV